MYKLTKLDIEEGKQSALPAGYGSTLPNLQLYDWETDTSKSIESFEDITEGWQIILFSIRDYHRTSKISKILKREPKKLLFKTQTSIYELEELE